MTLIKPNTKLVTPEKDDDEPLVPKGKKEVEQYLKTHTTFQKEQLENILISQNLSQKVSK